MYDMQHDMQHDMRGDMGSAMRYTAGHHITVDQLQGIAGGLCVNVTGSYRALL